MNVLTPTSQQHVEEALIADGLISEPKLDELKAQAQTKHQPILGLLLDEGHITDEQLTKALAQVNNVPYVNLGQTHIDPKVLELLPKDTAEHYMAVPLGEMQHK